jgi:hypothetical protein
MRDPYGMSAAMRRQWTSSVRRKKQPASPGPSDPMPAPVAKSSPRPRLVLVPQVSKLPGSEARTAARIAAVPTVETHLERANRLEACVALLERSLDARQDRVEQLESFITDLQLPLPGAPR